MLIFASIKNAIWMCVALPGARKIEMFLFFFPPEMSTHSNVELLVQPATRSLINVRDLHDVYLPQRLPISIKTTKGSEDKVQAYLKAQIKSLIHKHVLLKNFL